MERAIRHPDGRMISSAEWAAIRATSRQICAELAMLHIPSDGRQRGRSRTAGSKGPTKTALRTWHAAKWREAIARMEKNHPILALCASHWKAEHTLGLTLMARNQPARSKLSRPQESEASDDQSTHPTPAPSHSPHEIPAPVASEVLHAPLPDASEDRPAPRRSPRKFTSPAKQNHPKRPGPQPIHPNKRPRKPKADVPASETSEIDELIDELASGKKSVIELRALISFQSCTGIVYCLNDHPANSSSSPRNENPHHEINISRSLARKSSKSRNKLHSGGHILR